MKKLVFSAIAVVAVLSSACDKTPKAILEASTESIGKHPKKYIFQLL